MNWLKQNPILSALIVITVVCCAVVGYLLMTFMGSYEQSVVNYEAEVRKLQRLQTQSPFPSPENLEALGGQLIQYQQEVGKLKKSLGTSQVAVDTSITPEQFQDELRATVDAIEAKAEQAGVGLPEDFFLGFNEYAASLPSPAAAPALERQLRFIAGVVNELIGPSAENPGIRSIDLLTRPKLTEEVLVVTPADDDTGPPPPSLIPFSLGFTIEQGKFRIALNSLLDSPQFLLVRALSIKNSAQEGPLVEFPDDSAGSIDGVASESTDEPKADDLNVILGREVLSVIARIEMVDLRLAEAQTGEEN